MQNFEETEILVGHVVSKFLTRYVRAVPSIGCVMHMKLLTESETKPLP